MNKSLAAEIILDLKGNLASKAKAYSHQMTVLGSKSQRAMKMMNNSARAASRGIDTLGNRTMIGAGVMAVAFERTFIKTAAQFERYRVMLNQLQGSEAEGGKALSWIEDFTKNTPFAVNQVTDAFVRLKAFGIDPMDGSMQAIVDQASKMGGTAETVEGIATALGQAWTKGKLQNEEALQLLERGVPVWDYLVKVSKDLGHNNGFGYTAAELQKMASNGELGRESIRRLIEEMGKSSEGAALDQMKTWDGMLSNMGDHWTMFQKDVMQSGAFEKLKNELSEFLDKLDEMKETGEYDELVETVGERLVGAFKAAGSMIKAARELSADLLPVLLAVGRGVDSIAQSIGGYGNLAKTLAAVYGLNKAARFGAPVVKGVMALTTKKGNPVSGVLSAASAAAVQKVYVVNMPMGGGLDVLDGGKPPRSRIPDSLKPKTLLKNPAKLLSVVRAATVLGLLANANPYDAANPTFKPMTDMPMPNPAPALVPRLNTAQQQRANDAYQAAYGNRAPNPWGAMGQHPAMVPPELNGNIKIGIKVDQAGRVTKTTAASDLPGVAMED